MPADRREDVEGIEEALLVDLSDAGAELVDAINKALGENRDKVAVVAWTNYCTEELIVDFKHRGIREVLRKIEYTGNDLVEKVLSLAL